MDLARIKGNVRKMVDQGAPEADIDGYIASEGTTIDEVRAFKAQQPDVAVDMAKGAGYGFNEGFDATLNMIGAPIRAPINYISEKLGYGEAIPELQAARRFNVAGPAETTAGRTTQAIGEVAGASAIPAGGMLTYAGRAGAAAPGIIGQIAANPAKAAAVDAVSAVGSGLGVSYARENELGPTAELGFGLLGGYAAPNIANMATRSYAAAKSAGNYADKMVTRYRNPQQAADQDTVDALLRSGVTPDDLMKEYSPDISGNLQGRNFTPEKMLDMIGRANAGEDIATIAKQNGIGEGTLRDYLTKYKQEHITPRNITDVTQDLTDQGAAQPVMRLGRTSFGLADDANAASALTKRQNDQYGRVVSVINRAGGNRDYDATIDAIDEALTIKSQQAYGQAHANEQPFDLLPALKTAGKNSFQSAGRIREGLESAVDLFFESAAKANGKVIRRGVPIGDVPRYQAAREALDQMIQTSFHEGKPTPLTRRLTQFRQSLNKIVRDANPLLAAADDQFSGAKTTQALLKRGEDITTRLGSKTDDLFKDFNKLTPEQQEVVRLGFLRNLANKAANPREGAAVANQFQSQANKQIINRLFAPNSKLSGKQNKEIVNLGNNLIKGLRQEATTTNTLNFTTGRGNSPTAPWTKDMEDAQIGAETAADLATGNWLGVLRKTGKKLATQIGETQARAILKNLTETDPEQVIPMLQRLAREAKTTTERQAYVTALREFKRVGHRPAVEMGSVVEWSDDDQ